MSFNTCLLFWNDLLTPTIEKIIFLSSAIFFILVKLSILHSFHEIAVHHCLINQQACQQNERCSPELLSGDVFCVFPEEHAQHDARLPKQLIGVIARSALTVQRKTYHHPQELKQGETHAQSGQETGSYQHSFSVEQSSSHTATHINTSPTPFSRRPFTCLRTTRSSSRKTINPAMIQM